MTTPYKEQVSSIALTLCAYTLEQRIAYLKKQMRHAQSELADVKAQLEYLPKTEGKCVIR